MSDLPQPASAATPVPPPAPPRRSWVWRMLHSGLRSVAASMVLVAAGVGAAATWVWTTPQGGTWLLNLLPGVQTSELQGALGQPELGLKRLHWSSGGNTLDVTDLQLGGLQWQWRPQPGAWVGLSAQTLQASQAQWHSGPPSGSPPPTQLQWPFELAVAQASVAHMQVDALPALTDLHTALHLGADGGQAHTLTGLRFRSDRVLAGADLRLGSAAPLTLSADVALRSLPDAPRPWQAELHTQGPLAALQTQLHLSGTAGPQGTPVLDLQTTVHPFSAWPVVHLDLKTQALDLSTLHSGAPRTLLSGDAQIDSTGLQQPFKLALHLVNAQAGRWDAGALPLGRLDLQALGQPSPAVAGKAARANQPSLEQLTLQRFEADLFGPAGDTGQLSASGQWQRKDKAGEAQLKLTLVNLHPVALDKRLAPMRLSGPVALSLQGLPPPDMLLGLSPATVPAPQVKVDARLKGRMDKAAGGSPEVELRLDATASPQQLVLREARALAAGAQATLQGQVDRLPAERWHWQLHGALQDFDPLAWWPAPEGSALAKGPHRLNAQFDSDASAPTSALTTLDSQPLVAWQQIKGLLKLTVNPSQLAGVPVQGHLHLDSSAAAPVVSQWQLAGNSFSLQASATNAQDTHWQLGLQAPALANLAPLLALDDNLRVWSPSAGKLEGQFSADGHDTHWQWQGLLQASGLAGKAYQVSDIQFSGQGGSTADAPLSLQLKALGLQQGAARIDQITASVKGSLREHQLALQLDSPARPPPWFEQLLGARTGSGTRVQAAASGQWQPEAGAGSTSLAGRWQGLVSDLQGRARDGSGQAWLAGKDLRLAFTLDQAGALATLRAEPGRVDLPGTGLRWTAAQFERRAGRPLPQMNLQAQIEPFAVAPLLARAQPELGWGGDLTMGGDIHIVSAERFDADLVFERKSGDLSVADDVRDPNSRIQALALSDLRLGLAAHEGTWYFTQALAGKQLGEMAGLASVQTRADVAWPPAQSPLSGVLQMRVANLGAWGAWVPPGWRLGGELTTSASLGGRFGAPEITGELNGHNLSAYNVLQGLQLSDGQVRMVLQGDKAHIEQFSFKAGDGNLTLAGDATLGEAPQAQLKLTADHFLLLGRVDRRLVTSGQATLLLNRDAMKLDAQLLVNEGLIDFSRGGAPGLDDDVNVVDSSAPAQPVDPTPPKAARQLQLNAKLDLGQALRVKGRGLDTRLRGELKLTNPGGKLAVNGKVRTDAGTYAAYGQKLEIEHGELSFIGAVEDPQLDILAVRPNLDIKVGVAVTGSALNPRVRLASEPEMADADKLSWLMLGRAPEGLGKADTALLQRAAMALLAGEGEAPTDAILGALGITDFGVRQTTEGNVQDTVVSLGKQLGRHWYVGYERGVNATTGTWQLIYRLAQRFTLRAQSGADNALDLIWSWRLK